nr:hypothetical protein [Tanacetum cinerariifolium]
MNSYTFMSLDVKEGEKVNSRRKTFTKRAIAFIKSRRQANRLTRNNITRDRSGAHDRLVAVFFSENSIEAISGLLKCTSAIRQLTYDIHVDFLDEYMQISERTSRTALDHFCQAVIEIYGPEFLRKPTVTDIASQRKARVFEDNPFILLEAVASQDLWIWYAFFGVAGSNNDINVLYQSPLFNDLKTRRAPEISFVANGLTYPCGYYLVDEIYLELATLVKTIPEPTDDDHQRILYKQKHESTRKDVKREFGVLEKKWAKK